MQFQLPLTAPDDKVPTCFGKLWSTTAVECIGGLNPKFSDQVTGSHQQPRCSFYNTCGSKSSAERLLPTNQLVRPQFQPAPQAPQQPATYQGISKAASDFMARYGSSARPLAQMQPVQAAPQQAAPQWHPGQQIPQWQPTQAVVPQQVQQSYGMPVPYQAMVPMASQMPAYLSVPEPREAEDSIWEILGRELARGALKSLGHTIAHFFDTTSFRRPK